MPVRVLLVDEQPVVRSGLRAWLSGPDFRVVADVATGAEAIEAAVRFRPHVVVLEARLPDVSGPDLCASILKRFPRTAVIVFSACFEEATVVAATDAGARAYLLKDAVLDLADVVRRVAAGERFVDPSIAALLYRARGPRLTQQELSVLRLAAEGFTNPEIGARLFLSRHTVKEYLSHAMRKLGVESRVAAVVEAGRRGLLGPVPLSKAS